MNYLLDNNQSFAKSFIFWIAMFSSNKALTTSQRTVKNKIIFNSCVKKIEKSETITELDFYFKKIRNCGYTGLNIYHQPIFKLYKFLKEQKLYSMKDITSELVLKFLNKSTEGYSNATKKNYRISITNFFSYISSHNIDNKKQIYLYNFDFKNWEKNSITPKSNIPVYLTENEIRCFLRELEEYKKDRLTYRRNSFIIKLVLFTGLRSGEVINIRYKDIIEKENVYQIAVIGKGNKFREVLISKKHLEEYLNQRFLRLSTNDLVFKNFNGKKLSQAYISRVVDTILVRARIKKAKKGTHLLRHTFATQLYRKTKDVFLVKEALGHSDINTSMIYTHLDNDILEKTTSIMDELI